MTLDQVVAGLRSLKYSVLWAEETEDQYVIGFDFMHNPETPWTRGFHLDKVHATPELFVAEINEWKDDMKMRLSRGDVSPTMHNVIQHYGAQRLHDFLAAA